MESSALTLAQCLEQQRAAYRANPYPDLEQRKSDLAALHRFLKENEAAIIKAIDADFGVRPATTLRLIELFPRPSFILKRQLLWVPLFGWYMWKAHMIPVDRGRGSAAIEAMMNAAAR